MQHIKLYQYTIRMKNGSARKGLIFQNGEQFGDVAPLPGFSRETFEEAKVEAMRCLQSGRPPTLASVRFAWDCASRPFPTSLQVPIAALDREEEGFTAIKLKMGPLSVEEAISRVKQCKAAEIRLDFNRQWSLDKLLRFAAHFSPLDFAYFEEPTPKFEDILTFSHETGMPIAVDESIPQIPYWEIPTLRAVVIKPTILGNIPFVPPQAEMIFSSAYESGVGILHIAELALTHNPQRPHGLDSYSSLLEDVIDPRPIMAKGTLTWQATPLNLSESPWMQQIL